MESDLAESQNILRTSDSPDWLKEAIASLAGLHAAVLGDFCLDAYWSLDAESVELSIETGLPVRRVRSQRYSLGGAGNVVANLCDLGVGRVQAIGVVGIDMFGAELLRLLRERGVDTKSGMLLEADWQTMVYAKPYFRDVEESRIDCGAFNVLREETIDALIQVLEKAAGENDVIVLNQQIPRGVSNGSVIERINDVIAKYKRTRFIVDARDRPDLYRGAVLKLNTKEAGRFLGQPVEGFISSEKAKEYALQISQRTGKAAFLTRGERGIVVADGQAVDEIPGIQILEATDPVGAGDTVLAVLTALLGSGQHPFIAGRVANIAAAISVKKIQRTGTATPAEILAVGPTPDYIYEPDLAESPNFARYLKGTEIEQVLDLPKNLEIQHCVFDHDGTLSTLREGWEKIMEPMMVQAVLGSRFATADAMLYGKTVDKVRALIDRTTGIQTLMQMKGLTQLVRDAGLVPEDQILDEYGYKHVYNEALLKMVRIRMAKLEKGELDSNDFQIKNAVLLLKELHSHGIKLYLASGTDEADVIAEATAMGYAGLFEGRIFGAVGDINVEAKKMVLERIIREYKLAGHQFATFGDGPVEMRETKKRGGLCIGLASDEVRRYGWNLAKRSRLIRAGADLVAPDFSQLPAMLKTIGVA
jgi:rfaE bifunctional protein kinase chain/domain